MKDQKDYTYSINVKLRDDEVPAIMNKRTGEVKEIESNERQPKDKTMKYFDVEEAFSRIFTKAWKLLETQTTDKELAVALKLANRARAYTNDLRPLSPESSTTSIAEELNENRNTINKIVDKLFTLGVIAKFEIYNEGEHYQKYWIFNPYLCFNGKVIKKGVSVLFENTTYAMMIKKNI